MQYGKVKAHSYSVDETDQLTSHTFNKEGSENTLWYNDT